MMTFSRIAVITATTTTVVVTTDALRIVAPSEGITVVAKEPYTVQWNGASEDDVFNIDLYYKYYCGSYSFCFEQDDDDCGFYIADLCDAGGSDCVQDGSTAEVVMPEPIGAYSDDGYRVRISQVGNDKASCSDGFYLMSSKDAGGASLEVFTPTSEDMAVAGDEYTIQFDYDNGFGDRVGRFNIDLYASRGDGDCGTWITSICDKPDKGCHDTQGDYDVVIPASTLEGFYKIRVSVFGEEAVYGCSEAFGVVSPGEELWN